MSEQSQRLVILRTIAASRDRRAGPHYLPAEPSAATGLSHAKLQEALWALVADRLIYPYPAGQTAWENHRWELTDRGVQMAAGGEYQPHDPEGFLARLIERNAGLDELILVYAGEALAAYNSGCYLSAAVMIGVASERALLLLMQTFLEEVLDGTEQERFGTILESKSRLNYTFDEFRKRLEVRKNDLPEEIGENLSLHLDAVADLLRTSRNDAGHPTGRNVTRDDAYVNLQLFGRYIERLWSLRRYWAD
jgi:hypothetical protein